MFSRKEVIWDYAELDKHTWVPQEKREELKRLMAEWTGPGKGYVLIIQPPTPEVEGYTLFQPCVDPIP